MIPLSWTSLDTFIRCKLRWKLRYLDRVTRPENKRPFLVGLAVHNTIQAWHDSGWEKGYVLANLQNNFLDVVRDSGVRLSNEERTKYWERAVQAATITELIYLKLEFDKRDVTVEPRFNLDYGEGKARLRGGWDILDRDRGVVYDLKTGVTASGNVGQLLTYGVMAEIEGTPVQKGAFIYPLLEPKVQYHELSETRLEEHRSNMDNMVYAIDEGRVEWTANVQDDCYRCPYHRTRHCPSTFSEGVRDSEGKVRLTGSQGRAKVEVTNKEEG